MSNNNFQSQAAEFFKRTHLRGDCIEWKDCLNAKGYGIIAQNGKARLAHRVSYQLTRGNISNLCVCHTCDNPVCVNPNHLFLGTRADNNKDMINKGRQCRGMAKSLIMKNVAARGNKNGSRTHPEKIVKGERHPRAKLTTQDVLEILDLHSSLIYKQKELVVLYCISPAVISQIVNRKWWKHVR
jgi:hypothetical protein